MHLQQAATTSLQLRSFPHQRIHFTPDVRIFAPQAQGLDPRDRADLIGATVQHLQQALQTAAATHPRTVEQMLLILPDKTRTQMAANLLLDGAITLAEQYPRLTFTVLYGLGTHPLMEVAEIMALVGHDRYQKLRAIGTVFHQQSTKTVTNPMTFVTVWQDSPQQEILGRTLNDLRDSLRTAWATAERRGEQLWLGIFPEFMQQHEITVVEWLRSLHHLPVENLTPLQVDCRDPQLNDRLRQALAADPSLKVQVYTSLPELNQFPDKAPPLDIRFLDAHGDHGVVLRHGEKYVIEVPDYLFTHDLTIIAGDTRIHPYEGRYGSGGINKMLAVGIASMNEIRRSHSTRILTHPLTCPGEPGSPFVRRVAATARSIRDAMLTRPQQRVMGAPYGLTVIGQAETQIWDLAFGQSETARQDLAALFTQRYTVSVETSLDIVISDVELHKGTDITAGARALQYVADWHRPDNVLLHQPTEGCVALLFNPCNEPKNNEGVGNDGTKQHMDVLGDLLQEMRPQLSKNLGYATTPQAAQMMLTIARQTVMGRWQQHLCSNSELTDWLLELQRLALLGLQQAQQGTVARDLRKLLQERLDRYGWGPNHINRAIRRVDYQFQRSSDWVELVQALRELMTVYQEHTGLGEGGQRTIRLLKLCRTFKTLALATENLAVLNYLNWLDPPLTNHLPDPVRSLYHSQGIRASVLGLVPIHLKHTSADEAVQIAINYGHWHKPTCPDLRVGFLTSPLILKRSLPDD